MTFVHSFITKGKDKKRVNKERKGKRDRAANDPYQRKIPALHQGKKKKRGKDYLKKRERLEENAAAEHSSSSRKKKRACLKH